MNSTQATSSTSCRCSCTCREPQLVSISLSARAENKNKNNHDHHHHHQQRQEKLHENLSQLGWSPIRVTGMPTPSPSHEQIQTLFTNGTIDSSSNDINPLTYRSNQESGGSGAESEPKESLEVLRRHADKKREHDVVHTQVSQVQDWCRGLSSIAQRVSDLLELPPNTLSTASQKDDDDDDDDNSLDLLRVFYYHATETRELGSSPHTDWGTWTVVWQDAVGGLQHYCRACHQWLDVPTSSSNNSSTTADNSWDCIIHVGDMASLALTASAPSAMDNKSILWPSPRHRVLTCGQERTSLVYFAYPPSSLTLKELEEALVSTHNSSSSSSSDHKQSTNTHRLPLDEYYLLHNQASASSEGDIAKSKMEKANETYQRFRPLTIEQIIQAKWTQVQRST